SRLLGWCDPRTWSVGSRSAPTRRSTWRRSGAISISATTGSSCTTSARTRRRSCRRTASTCFPHWADGPARFGREVLRDVDSPPVALTIGIVGLPNAGKSTLFNALTKNDVLAANYPFATIEPNVGVVGVPDERLPKLAEVFGSEKILPATVEFVDIAGI